MWALIVPLPPEGFMRCGVLISCVLAALGLTVSLQSTSAYAATPDDETLKGIGAVKVFVEGVDPADKPHGLTRGQLQTDVESRLRNAGITVSVDATEYLYVNVNTLRSRQTVTSFSVVVMVRQSAYLVRNASINVPAAITWWKGTDGIIVTHDLSGVRDAVGDLVDQFISAYRKQNPKR